MLVAQPGRPPVIAQFDIRASLRTCPLVTGFSHPLPNQLELDRAIAEYRADERRGFIEQRNVLVSSQPVQVAWTGYNSPNQARLTLSVAQLSPMRGQSTSSGGGGFVNVGQHRHYSRSASFGILRPDLDLHLTLPDQQQVFYANRSVTFNSGRATATLDHDNLAEHRRRRQIIGREHCHQRNSSARHLFVFVNSFSTSNPSDPS